MSSKCTSTRIRSRALAVVLVAVVPLTLLLPSPAHASNDTHFAKQWTLTQIGAPAAWSRTTGSGVRIGIVDTGVDLAHEDLAGKVVAHTSCLNTRGSASSCRGSGQDDHGHGSHVAGIAAARKDNGVGIAGVAPDAQLVVAKAVTGTGAGTSDDINAAIHWVVDHGAKVVNLSLGELFLTSAIFGTAIEEGIRYAWSRGAVPVLAAGNLNILGLGGQGYGNLPALVVGATGRDGQEASYSSSLGSAQWALLAPGGEENNDESGVYSAWIAKGEKNQYRYRAGTSMAAPHVSGAVALLLAQGLSPQETVTRILQTASTKVRCSGANCAGRLDVARATGAGEAAVSAPRTPRPSRPTSTEDTPVDQGRSSGGGLLGDLLSLF